MESVSSSKLWIKQRSGLSLVYEHDIGHTRFVLNLIQIVPRHALGILKPEDVFYSTRLPIFQVL